MMSKTELLKELNEIRSLREDIEDDRNRLARLQALASGSRGPMRHGSAGTANQDPMATLVAELDTVRERILRRTVAAESRILDLEHLVDVLPGPQRRVLRLRYFEGYDWEKIADTMYYSARRCMQLQQEALAGLMAEEHSA